MHTPTVDHQEAAPQGACACAPASVCPDCAARVQRMRYQWELERWAASWGNRPRSAVRGRPHLRLVPGGR